MATIRHNAAQQRALDEINRSLEKIAAVNAIEKVPFPIGTMTIKIAGADKKKSGKIELDGTDKETAAIIKVFGNYRDRLAKEIIAKAKKYDIVLDQSDLALLKKAAAETAAEEDTSVEEQLPAEAEIADEAPVQAEQPVPDFVTVQDEVPSQAGEELEEEEPEPGQPTVLGNDPAYDDAMRRLGVENY